MLGFSPLSAAPLSSLDITISEAGGLAAGVATATASGVLVHAGGSSSPARRKKDERKTITLAKPLSKEKLRELEELATAARRAITDPRTAEAPTAEPVQPKLVTDPIAEIPEIDPNIWKADRAAQQALASDISAVKSGLAKIAAEEAAQAIEAENRRAIARQERKKQREEKRLQQQNAVVALLLAA